MSIDDIESDPDGVTTMADHLQAALEHADDATARFHLRHAIQLLEHDAVRGDGPQVEADGGNESAGSGV